jgi:glucose 1-dehydrogenase
VHGFQAEFVVDHQRYLIKVPEELRRVAVLCEPTSVVEKAIDMVAEIQKNRLPDWAAAENIFEGRRVLIAGVGAIGLLAAMVFLLEGAQVWGYDIAEPGSIRARLLEEMGGKYICAKETKPKEIKNLTQHVDVILEAAGNTKLDFDLLSALSENGVYALTGVTQRNQTVSVDGGSIMEDIVLKNQVIVGSVNAHIRHWEKAIEDLLAAKQKWKTIPDAFITNRFSPEDFKVPFFSRPEQEIKTIIVWSKE